MRGSGRALLPGLGVFYLPGVELSWVRGEPGGERGEPLQRGSGVLLRGWNGEGSRVLSCGLRVVKGEKIGCVRSPCQLGARLVAGLRLLGRSSRCLAAKSPVCSAHLNAPTGGLEEKFSPGFPNGGLWKCFSLLLLHVGLLLSWSETREIPSIARRW